MNKANGVQYLARPLFKDALTSDELNTKYPFFTSRLIEFSNLKTPLRKRYNASKSKNAFTVKADMLLWNKKSPRDSRTIVLPQQKQVLGVDTETIKGKVELLADSNANSIYQPDYEELLNFFYHKRYDRTLNMFYNLKYDANAILALVDRFTLQDLHLLGKASFLGSELTLIPRKLFTIKYKKRTFKFYDILQHYLMTLDKASKKYLNESKSEMSYEALKSRKYWNDNLSKITDYCIRDSVLTAKLGILSQKMYNELALNFNSPISTAYMAEQLALTYSNIPYYRLPDVHKWGYYAYGGGWFELHKRGYYEESTKLDIRSAYPFIMAQLPDLDGAQWVQSDQDDPTVQWGIVRGLFKSKTKNSLQPLPVAFVDSLKYPVTNWHYRYMGLEYYRDLVHRELIDSKGVRYMLMYPASDYKPFAYMEPLYETRRKMKDAGDFRELPRKIGMNSTYGKLIQVNDFLAENGIFDTGKLFLPIYAHWITEGCRHQILSKILDNDYDVLAIHTDSIIIPDREIISSKKLGDFATEIVGEYLGVGTGIYAMRNDEETSSHFRGIYNTSKLNLFDVLEENKSKSNIVFERERPLGLGEIVMHTRKRAGNTINQWIEDKKILSANGDFKRNWRRKANNFNDLLTNSISSRPLKI